MSAVAKRREALAPFAFPALPLKLYKVSTESVAAGKVLARSAKRWEGVYVPALELIIAAEPVAGFYGGHADAMEIASKATVCGIPARQGAPSPSRFEYALITEDDRCWPSLDDAFFRFGKSYWEWTSTRCAPAECAWAANVYDGDSFRLRRSILLHVRACCPSQGHLDLGISRRRAA